MSVEIKLRSKYRNVVKGRFKSSHNDQGTKHKTKKKIGYDKHVAQLGPPRMRAKVLLLPSGKLRMYDYDDVPWSA